VRPVSRVYRNASLAALAAAAIVVAGACGSSGAAPEDTVRLIDQTPVEKRAGSPIEEAVRIEDTGSGADRARAIRMRAPTRVIWSVVIPFHARLRTAVALVPDHANADGPLGPGVTVRIGIADKRSYEELARVPVLPPSAGAAFWQPIDVDLGAYRGWQWSIFYRPGDTPWRLNFSVDAIPGAGTVAWREPAISGTR
jgi:hypothetical protein